jgi:MoaA/NifB/PqqE/SkfB family radical SAM enzyme
MPSAALTLPVALESATSHGLLFPNVPAMVARETDGYLLLTSAGMRATIRGPICEAITESIAAGAVTPALARFAVAHDALAQLTNWFSTPAVPLDRRAAVQLNGFDTIFIELLGRCNERCVHCYADSAPTVTDALERELALGVVEQAVAAGFSRIQFTGGDPLLCDFLPDAVELARRLGAPHVEIFTNGLALTEELADKLAPYKPNFAFSVYSTNPDVHDATTRTPGSHRRTLAAIDRVVARGLSCRAAAVVLDENENVADLVAMLKARGVGFVSWTHAFSVGRGTAVAETSTAALRTATRPAEAMGGGHSDGDGDRHALGKLCVTYTGDVVPCIFQRQSVLGNVRHGTLQEILDRGTGLPKRGLPTVVDAQERLQCSGCRLTDAALGWLRARRA